MTNQSCPEKKIVLNAPPPPELENALRGLTTFAQRCAELERCPNGMQPASGLQSKDDTEFYLKKAIDRYGMDPVFLSQYLDQRDSVQDVGDEDCSTTDDSNDSDCVILEEEAYCPHYMCKYSCPHTGPCSDGKFRN